MTGRRPPTLTLSAFSLAEFGLTTAALRAAGLGDRAPVIEILWDNFVSLDPARLADDLAAMADRTMLHIMWSRYLDLDDRAFATYLEHVHRHVEVLRPLAVSDHLARFQFEGAYVGAGQERSYDDLDHVCERVARYQDAIGATLLVENTASSEHPAAQQIEFLGELMRRTGCGILFDISNAVVGELNGLGPVAAWLPLIAGRSLRCHVGSYMFDDEVSCYVDSHDSSVTSPTAAAVAAVLRAADVESITYERDFNRTLDVLVEDLQRIGAACT